MTGRMSNHPGGRPRVDRVDLARSAVLLAAFAVTVGGLHTILEGVVWWWVCLLCAAIVTGIGVGTRALFGARSALARILAPLLSAAVAAATVVALFASDVSWLGFVPTERTIERFATLFRDAGYSITWQDVPANVDPPILSLLVIGTAALFLLAELATFSLRLPAVSGLLLAAVFLVPGLTPEGETDGAFFAASALAYLALLLVGRGGRPLPAMAIAAGAVAGGLLLPGILPSTELTVTSSGLGPSVSTGVNPMIRLGDDLRQNEKHVALTYSTVSGRPEYLRLVEVSDFFDNEWGPSQPHLDPENRPVAMPRPPGLAVGISTENEVSYVHVANLLSPWLPMPYPASSVTGLTGSWQYLPDSFTVASNLTLARGENYTVSSVVLTPTPEQLLAAGQRVPDGLGDYLSLPPDTPEVVADTAREVTAGETSNYARALALQGYLRSAPFRYSLSAPVSDGYDGTGVEAVAAFLEAHRGYCIHFASAMAVMARELGIPSRIIVGFQPGSLRNGDDRGRKLYEVTTQDLHAWPELYFDGIGWLRFEPTPSRGAVPDYANPGISGVPDVPVAGGAPSPGRSPSLGDGLAPQLDAGPTVARWLTVGQWPAWLALVGGLVVATGLVLLPAGIRSARRRRRIAALQAGRGSATSAWQEVLETAEDAGVVVAATLTPREAVARLGRLRGMNDESRAALAALGLALEREGYGRPGQSSAATGQELAVLLKTVLSRLRAGADSPDRLRTWLLPPSLVARAGRLAGRTT